MQGHEGHEEPRSSQRISLCDRCANLVFVVILHSISLRLLQMYVAKLPYLSASIFPILYKFPGLYPRDPKGSIPQHRLSQIQID